jgi:hypothetical protein
LKAWEIWSYQPAGWPEPHPAVIISSAARVAKKPELNVLMCSSKAATRPAEPNEVILDVEDGLSWPTLCKCDLIHLVSRDQLTTRRGQITEERRRRIIATMTRSNDWL